MGIKHKRKVPRETVPQCPVRENIAKLSVTEPAAKKAKIISGDELHSALKGPNPTEALKEWLYLVSNMKERAQLDKDAGTISSKAEISKISPVKSQNGGSETSDQNETQQECPSEDDEMEEEPGIVIDKSSDTDEVSAAVHIDSYLSNGGSFSELLNLLPSPEDAKLSDLRYVFGALYKIILRVAAVHQERISEAVEACRQVLQSYIHLINDVLNTKRSVRDRKLNLQLLTAMVTLDSKLGKEVLSTILLEAETVEKLSSLVGSLEVRVAYINFLVALLIDNDPSLVLTVVNKPWLITNVLEGLQYDPCQTIVLLLTTLKRAVVENTSVSKTSKMTIFTSDGILCLLHLYKWKGPQNRPRSSLSFWAMKKMAKKQKPLEEASAEEAGAVAVAVHDLLLLLLTHHRYGIIFRDASIAHPGERHNKLVAGVLQRVGHPWEHSRVSDLIAQVLAACPDSMRSTMTAMEPFFVPRSTPKWIHCVTFMKKVLAAQNPEYTLYRQLSNLTMNQLGGAMVETCCPPPIVRALCTSDAEALCNPDADLAVNTADLLVTMLQKVLSFVNQVRKWAASGDLSYAQATSFRKYVSDFVFKHMPNVTSIGRAWENWSSKLSSESTDDESSQILSLLSLLLELLELYQRLSPTMLDQLLCTQSGLKENLTQTVLRAGSTDDGAHLRLRLYHLLLSVDDQSFCLENAALHEPLVLLFQDLLRNSKLVQSMAWSALHSLIRRAGSLEGSPLEALVWLSAYQDSFSKDGKIAGDVAEMLAESMRRAVLQGAKYFDVIARSEEHAVERASDGGDGIAALQADSAALQELFDDVAEGCKELQLSDTGLAHLNCATLSPWVVSLLEVLTEYSEKNKDTKRSTCKLLSPFLSRLLLRLLFRLPRPAALLHLVISNKCALLPKSLKKYLQSWLPEFGEPQPISVELYGEDSSEVKISEKLLTCATEVEADDEISKVILPIEVVMMKQIEEDSTAACREYGTLMVQLSHLVLFHITQLAGLGQLNEVRSDLCRQALSALMTNAANMRSAENDSSSSEYDLQILKVVLSHPMLLHQFSPISKHTTASARQLTHLTVTLVNGVKNKASIATMLLPFKNKLLGAISNSIRKRRSPKDDPVLMVDAFKLSSQDTLQLLELLMELNVSNLLSHSKAGCLLSPWCKLVAYLLKHSAELRLGRTGKDSGIGALPIEMISKISTWLTELTNEDVDQSPLFDAVLLYLKSCPQHTSHVSPDLLPRLLKVSKLDVKGSDLAIWLCSFIEAHSLWTMLDKACGRKRGLLGHPSLLLPILGNISEEPSDLTKSVFQLVYKKLGGDIELAMTDVANHPSWLPPNIGIIVALIEECMDSATRKNIRASLKTKAPLLTNERQYYLPLVECVLRDKKAQFLKLLLAWLGAALKKHSQEGGQATLVQKICQAILRCVDVDAIEIEKDKWVPVQQSNVWQESLRLVLKMALSSPGRSKQEHSSDVPMESESLEQSEIQIMDLKCHDVSSLLLRVLSALVRTMYTSEDRHEHISVIHEMTTSHSEFLSAMMNTGPSKVELVRLLRVLAEKDPQVINSNLVPVLLSAYSASLSEVDQELLRLLKLYESSGASLANCRPYLWGHQGASHYSVWSLAKNGGRSLWEQPRSDQVLSLLDPDTVQRTIAHFPLIRSLNVEELMKCSTDIVYDPAFYLPLFSHLLSPESPVLTHMFIRTGALALTFAALSSYDVTVRAGAYSTLARFLSHLEMARGRDKDLLLQFISTIRLGVAGLGEPNPRLTSIVSVFLARTTLELANPLSLLYRPLMNYILAKPALNLRTVPEFMPLLHSEHVEHIEHRHWILRVVAEGLRSTADVVLCLEAVVFKLILSFYSCRVADEESQELVLLILQAAFQVQYGACRLVRDYGLTSWLHQAILSLQPENKALVIRMVEITDILWKSLTKPFEGRKDAETGHSTPRVEGASATVLRLLRALFTKLTVKSPLSVLLTYVNTLSDVASTLSKGEMALSYSRQDVSSLVDLCSSGVENSAQLYDMIELGCSFIPKVKEGGDSITRVRLEEKLQSFIMLWLKATA